MRVTFEKPRFVWKRGRTRPLLWLGGITIWDDDFHSKSIQLSLSFEPRDIWIGCYWNAENCKYWNQIGTPKSLASIDFYFILIPMIPLKVNYHHHNWKSPCGKSQ